MPVDWPVYIGNGNYTHGTWMAAGSARWDTTWTLNNTYTYSNTLTGWGSGGGGNNSLSYSSTTTGAGGGGGTTAWRPLGYLDGEVVTRQERRVLQDEDRQQRAVARDTALVVAEELLSSMLTEDQRQSWALNGYFEVIGSHGTLYRLHRGVSGNVEWVRPDGQSGGRLCAHPTMRETWLPTPDVLLAQMLALSTNEREWLALANVHQGNRPQLVGVR